MRSTDFPHVVSPYSGRRRLANGGTANNEWTVGPGMPASPVAPAIPSGPSTGYMPTTSSIMSDAGINPMLGNLGLTALSSLFPGMKAMTGLYNTVARVNNTLNNDSMLSSMNSPLSFGQMVGGFLGANSYGNDATTALNAAMQNPDSRSNIGGYVAGQNAGYASPLAAQPTQTAPVTPVASSPLGAPTGALGGLGSSGGGFNTGSATSSGFGTQGGGGFSPGAASGEASAAGYARGGRAGARATRGRPAHHVVVVMPSPILGALALVAAHHLAQRARRR
jgi:hypothetical protein